MKRRSLLALALSTATTLTAGCSSDGSDGDTETATPTPSPTPSPTPTPEPGQITSVEVYEIPQYGLNILGFSVTLGQLQSGVNYRVRITVESDAGSNVAVFGVRSEHGFQAPGVGGEVAPPEGTTTDGTELTYRVELRRDGETVDEREDTTEFE